MSPVQFAWDFCFFDLAPVVLVKEEGVIGLFKCCQGMSGFYLVPSTKSHKVVSKLASKHPGLKRESIFNAHTLMPIP